MSDFPDGLRSSLARLVERAEAEYGNVSSQDDWPLCAPESELEDAKVVQQALNLLGYEVGLPAAFAVWEMYSMDLSAGWMDGPDSTDEAIGAMQSLCENIANGQDYAGFSKH